MHLSKSFNLSVPLLFYLQWELNICVKVVGRIKCNIVCKVLEWFLAYTKHDLNVSGGY